MQNSCHVIRVVHIINGLNSGGAERMLVNFVLQTDSNCINNTVVSLTGFGMWGEVLVKNGIQTIALNLDFSLKSLTKLLSLCKTLLKIKPNILQTWMHHSNFLGTILGKLLSIPLIIWNIRCSHVIGSYYSSSSRVIFKLTNYLSGMPAAIITNSYAGKQDHEKTGYRAKAWVYMPNGFDVNKFCPSQDKRDAFRKDFCIRPEEFVVGMIARYDPMKNHAGFLRGAVKFIQHYPNSKFVLVGKNIKKENKELVALLADVDLDKHFIFLGERKDIENIIPALDVLSLFSLFGEGFPNVIGEAMSCGITCVASDVGDAKVVIGDTGFIVTKNDVDALVEAWEKIIKLNKQQRIELSALARKRILENFDLKDIANRYHDFYKTLFEQGQIKYCI